MEALKTAVPSNQEVRYLAQEDVLREQARLLSIACGAATRVVHGRIEVFERGEWKVAR